MFDFKEIKDGSINIVGLNSELECIYIDDLYKKYSKKKKSKTKKKFNNQSTNPFLHNYFYKTKK